MHSTICIETHSLQKQSLYSSFPFSIDIICQNWFSVEGLPYRVIAKCFAPLTWVQVIFCVPPVQQ